MSEVTGTNKLEEVRAGILSEQGMFSMNGMIKKYAIDGVTADAVTEVFKKLLAEEKIEYSNQMYFSTPLYRVKPTQKEDDAASREYAEQVKRMNIDAFNTLAQALYKLNEFVNAPTLNARTFSQSVLTPLIRDCITAAEQANEKFHMSEKRNDALRNECEALKDELLERELPKDILRMRTLEQVKEKADAHGGIDHLVALDEAAADGRMTIATKDGARK